jgi:hypothetical protein
MYQLGNVQGHISTVVQIAVVTYLHVNVCVEKVKKNMHQTMNCGSI